jgi:hypothetical protein
MITTVEVFLVSHDGKPEVVKPAIHVSAKNSQFSWICASGGPMLTAGP